jgi:large subunit ribosomal protein L31e
MVDERQYVIPLRKEWLKVPKYKRAKKAGKAIKEFLARHFRVEMKDVRVGRWLNEEIWARGIKKPPHKIKIKASKDDKGLVWAELLELSDHANKVNASDAKRRTAIDGKKAEKKKVEEAMTKATAEAKKKKTETEKKEGEIMKDHQEKAEDAQKVNVTEEKLMKKEMAKEHHPKPHVNLPHEKAQSKHPVRQSLEK